MGEKRKYALEKSTELDIKYESELSSSKLLFDYKIQIITYVLSIKSIKE